VTADPREAPPGDGSIGTPGGFGAIAPPAEFDPGIYVRFPGQDHLRGLDPSAARAHYWAEGRAAGLVANAVSSRAALCGLVPQGTRILEIGPSVAPGFRAPAFRVRYLDVVDTDGLRAFAAATGQADPDLVPRIDYVWRGEAYRDLLHEQFDAIYSSHNIEHHPCLVRHLADAADVLAPGGCYLLAIPDKRFCYDHFLPETTLSDVLEAHLEGRMRHAPRHVLDNLMHLAHNESDRHWAGDHGENPFLRGATEADRGGEVRFWLDHYRRQEGYVDVHAWRFTPDNFRVVLSDLNAAGLSRFRVEAVYPTIRNGIEFYAILRHAG